MQSEPQVPSGWSDAERWAWGEIHAGRIADFNERYQNKIDPKKPDDWVNEGKDRLLTLAFLVTILTNEDYRRVTPFKGVRINGACFEEEVDLRHARIECQLFLENCRFLGALNLVDLQINGWFSLDGSWIGEAINLGGAVLNSYVSLRNVFIVNQVCLADTTISGWLSMEYSTFKQKVDMIGTKIGSHLRMGGSTFEGRLIMNGIEVSSSLNMSNKAVFKQKVDLTSVKIGSQISMIGSTFEGALTMNGTEVGQHLLMRDKAIFKKEVDLGGTKIGSQLSMVGSTFEGALTMNGTEVGNSLFMRGKAIFMKKVDLTGAKIDGGIDMSTSTFEGPLIMNGTEVRDSLLVHDKAIFKKEIDLTGTKIGGQISMIGSTFEGALTMNGTEVGQHLLMQDKAIFKKEIHLTGTKIGGHIGMIGSTFEGALTMNGTEVGNSLFMRGKAIFMKEIDLTGAKIDGGIDMSTSTFEGPLIMNGTEVGQHLLMRDKAIFKKEIKLMSVKIGGIIDMSTSIFEGALSMNGTEVGQSLFARSCHFPMDCGVIFDFSRIGSNCDLSGATISELDLTSSTIVGELRLGSEQGSEPTKWINNSRMVLRNTTVGSIKDAEIETNSWPKNLVLKGLTYRGFGSLGEDGSADTAKPKIAWFENWLKRDSTFSPQPYETLADLFRELGYPSQANTILYAARERTRREAWERRQYRPELGRAVGLMLMKLTIGYGLGSRYFLVIFWFLGLTLLGFLLLLYSCEESTRSWVEMTWASLDQALPVVTLNKDHEKLILGSCCSWVLAYFYVQKLIGFILGGFLVSGLAGLTQKN